MHDQNITYAVAFSAGLFSFISPCVLPLIPSYITYITGLSFHDLQVEHPTHIVRRKTIFHSICFVLGFTAIFVLFGASATFAGSLLQRYSSVIRKIGGLLIVLFGIHTTGVVPFGFLLGEKRVTIRNKPAGYVGSFLVGLVFAAGWTPCIGPILAAILMIAANEKQLNQGILLLLIYSLGLGIPFILSSLALHHFLSLFNRFKRFIRIFELITGIFLVLVGIMIFFNWLSRLSSYASYMFGGA